MLRTTISLIEKLQKENSAYRKENKRLKKKLGFAHTKINDLRYAKKQRDEFIARKADRISAQPIIEIK